jgi:hypothetical protein
VRPAAVAPMTVERCVSVVAMSTAPRVFHTRRSDSMKPGRRCFNAGKTLPFPLGDFRIASVSSRRSHDQDRSSFPAFSGVEFDVVRRMRYISQRNADHTTLGTQFRAHKFGDVDVVK